MIITAKLQLLNGYAEQCNRSGAGQADLIMQQPIWVEAKRPRQEPGINPMGLILNCSS
jgi:hypothetical protein